MKFFHGFFCFWSDGILHGGKANKDEIVFIQECTVGLCLVVLLHGKGQNAQRLRGHFFQRSLDFFSFGLIQRLDRTLEINLCTMLQYNVGRPFCVGNFSILSLMKCCHHFSGGIKRTFCNARKGLFHLYFTNAAIRGHFE